MSAESTIQPGKDWQQPFSVFGDDQEAFDGTGWTFSAVLKIEGAAYTVTAGWVSPASGGVALISCADAVTATMPSHAVGECECVVTQGAVALHVGTFTVHTGGVGIAAPTIEGAA